MVIDHDIYFIDIVSDSLLVFNGLGGSYGNAEGPMSARKGMNKFLKDVEVIFVEITNHIDLELTSQVVAKIEQKASGEYFYLE